jgi:hypothetical protein
MIVYRFEKNGIGPYTGGVGLNVSSVHCGVSNKWARRKSEHIRKRIGVNWDMRGRAHSDRAYIYGCPTKETLRAYFGFRFKELFASGYRIKKYQVPDELVLNAGIECAFPVKYHKFKTKKALESALLRHRGY